jgi:hypothetical protein
MCIVVALLPLIIRILITIWAYKDAKARGGSVILAIVLVWVLGIIGLIIWLVVRPKEMASPPMAPPPMAPPPMAPPPQ